MPFPAVQRVIYRRNPLEQAICQLRFPADLRIDAELPVALQTRLRSNFPNFTPAAEMTIELPAVAAAQTEILRQTFQSLTGRNYAFSSGDGSWVANLTRTFISLTTTNAYERWETFRNQLNLLLQALIETYEPAYLTRIGLRYVNVIRRSRLGLQDVPWRALLSPTLIGMLGSVDTADSVDSLESVHEIRLSEGGNARIVVKLPRESTDQEATFTIDGDFFESARTEIDRAVDRLNYLNSRASRFIHWAITDRLHQAMEPQPI